jgi:hypothetical protein
VNSPCHDVIAMKAAMPAPDPAASYAPRTPARARSAPRRREHRDERRLVGHEGGTSSGWAATSASAVTAPRCSRTSRPGRRRAPR